MSGGLKPQIACFLMGFAYIADGLILILSIGLWQGPGVVVRCAVFFSRRGWFDRGPVL